MDGPERKGAVERNKLQEGYITLPYIILYVTDIAAVVFMLVSLTVLGITGELLSLYYPNPSRPGQLRVSTSTAQIQLSTKHCCKGVL